MDEVVLNENEFIKGATQSVFVSIYSRKTEKIKSVKKDIPGILIIFRSDGKLGLPGGRMESRDLIDNKLSTESLKETAIRETREEIGYEIKNKELLKWESSILINKNNQITNFSYLVTDEELNKIYKDYNKTINKYYNEKEIYGLNRVYLTANNINNILNNNFKLLAKNELIKIIRKYFKDII